MILTVPPSPRLPAGARIDAGSARRGVESERPAPCLAPPVHALVPEAQHPTSTPPDPGNELLKGKSPLAINVSIRTDQVRVRECRRALPKQLEDPQHVTAKPEAARAAVGSVRRASIEQGRNLLEAQVIGLLREESHVIGELPARARDRLVIIVSCHRFSLFSGVWGLLPPCWSNRATAPSMADSVDHPSWSCGV